MMLDDGGIGDGCKRDRAGGQGQQDGADEYELSFHGNVSFPFQRYGKERRPPPDTFLHETGTGARRIAQRLWVTSPVQPVPSPLTAPVKIC
ncbi:hypothetical protein MesoLj113c_60120 [Mesorhizobium sp. 113-3-9]|nr:hypothetical protein MesoLj113c_60120 [Mesorhizobium sp. 113-3-9]